MIHDITTLNKYESTVIDIKKAIQLTITHK